MLHSISLQTADGVALSATLHGDPTTAHAGLLIAPAMGVPQTFYAEFAQWLAQQGWAVLVFDYRGMGASRPARYARSLRGFEADILTWAERDCAAALNALRGLLPAQVPIDWLGHSLGGQVFGLVPGRERVRRVVTIACGSGYWRENAPQLKRVVWWMWYLVVPLAVPLAGYFPGRRLGMVGDLPRGVITQWRRWCLHRDYMMGEGGQALRTQFAALRAPMLSLSFSDDEFMSARNIDALHDFYAGAPKQMRCYAPQELGVKRIGHFGFFKPAFQATLWPHVTAFLAADAAQAA